MTTRHQLLLDPATDWTNQSLHERLRLSLGTLYVHGFIAPAEYRRQCNRLTLAVECAASSL